MGFKICAVEGDKYELELSDEPSYVYALKMAPEALEPELNSGTWLVVTFPVWSAPVRHSVRAAVACAKLYGGKFHLGVRPFKSYEEMRTWWPTNEVPAGGGVLWTVQDNQHRREIYITTDTSNDPAWLALKDGQVVYQGNGRRSVEQLREIMSGIIG